MSQEEIFTEITVGLGQLLAASGIGVWGGPFATDDVALVFGPIPQGQARAIGLTPYPVSSDRGVGKGVLGVQFYFREVGMLELIRTRGTVKELLDMRPGTITVGGHDLPLIWWSSGADMGSDGSGSVTTAGGRRHEASDNYYMHYSQPER